MAQAMTGTAAPSKVINVGLWVVQVLLAVAFTAAGLTKVLTPAADLAQMMPWAAGDGIWVARVAGASELVAVLGLLLPSLTRVMPKLTGLAALGLVVVMVLAAGLHASRGEFALVVPNLVLLSLCAFVAVGRLRLAPLAPRS